MRDLLRHQAVRERVPVLLRGQEFALPVPLHEARVVLLEAEPARPFCAKRVKYWLGDRVPVLPFSLVPLLEGGQEVGEVCLATSTRLLHKATGSLGLARGSALRVELVLLHESLPDGLLAE